MSSSVTLLSRVLRDHVVQNDDTVNTAVDGLGGSLSSSSRMRLAFTAGHEMSSLLSRPVGKTGLIELNREQGEIEKVLLVCCVSSDALL